MSTTTRSPEATATTPTLAFTGHVLMWNAPSLLVTSFATIAALVPGVLLSRWFAPLGVGIAVLLGVAAWSTCVAVAEHAFRGDDAPFLTHMKTAVGALRPGLSVAAPVSFAAMCFSAGWTGYEATGTTLFLLPAAVSGALAVALGLAVPLALTMSSATDIRGRKLWSIAIGLVATHPSGTLAVTATMILALLCATDFLFSLALLAPGIIAALTVLVTRQATARRALLVGSWINGKDLITA